MRRFIAANCQNLAICLLLATATAPSAQIFARTLVEQQESKARGGDQEEECAKEAAIHVVRRHGREHKRSHASSARRHLFALGATEHERARDPQWCLSDGLRGELRLRNGCGAVLLC